MIPRALTDWDYETIKDLTTTSYLETDTFEFKLAMKSRDPTIDGRIKETACAFANTNGGFIIFGVLITHRSAVTRLFPDLTIFLITGVLLDQ